jgi:hypothetical protein
MLFSHFEMPRPKPPAHLFDLVLAERQKFSALLKMLRAGLTDHE